MLHRIPIYDADRGPVYRKDFSFKTCDGKDVAAMEEVMQYNKIFYGKMMNNFEEKGIHI